MARQLLQRKSYQEHLKNCLEKMGDKPSKQKNNQYNPIDSQSNVHLSVDSSSLDPSSSPYIASSSFPASPSQGHVNLSSRSNPDSKYTKIGDDYSSLSQVSKGLSDAGLESSNLIVGIDFTRSNEWTGEISFNKKCLHHLGGTSNPYEQAISIIGRTLSSFDDDNLIPCYGFGDVSTHDQEVFNFYPDERSCNGFEEVLSRYRELVPHVRLSGPTSFAPIIEAAIRIVDNSGGQYHVLMIIADGQVTRSADINVGQFSPQEQKTINAIVKASEYALSIVLVGVGDGPWDVMQEFDDNIPARAFDNFQFVNFTKIMSQNSLASNKEAEFALAALMEIPKQYKATIELHLLGRPKGQNSFLHKSKPSTKNSSTNNGCPSCFGSKRDLAFGGGHQTCRACGKNIN